MNQQRAEPLQRREALELDELVVAQVDAVKLVLCILMATVFCQRRWFPWTARTVHVPVSRPGCQRCSAYGLRGQGVGVVSTA